MSENPEPNIPLLRKCVEWAEAEAAKPFELSEWDQAEWRSPAEKRKMRDRGAGNEIVYDQNRRPVLVQDLNPQCGTSFCLAGYACEVSGLPWRGEGSLVKVDGQWETAASAAQDLLGLGTYEADTLFAGSNSIETVRMVAENIAGERL